MFDAAMREYFHAEDISSSRECEVYYEVLRKRKFALYAGLQVRGLVVLKSNEIAMHRVFDDLMRDVSVKTHDRIHRITCTWIVCSERGGIYLYEALAVRDNAAYKNMRSKFVVMNSLDGTISFGPGHALNTRYSETMRDLMESYRYTSKDKWFALFQEVVLQLYQK